MSRRSVKGARSVCRYTLLAPFFVISAKKGGAPVPMTILIVDDDPNLAAFLAAALSDEGYDTQCAATPQELDYALATPPDLVLLDVMMPQLDGVQVSQW